MEEILNVEVVVPQLEYTTHEQYTMQQEREANRKLKAQIRKNRKLKKGIGIKQQVEEDFNCRYTNLTKETMDGWVKHLFNTSEDND